VNREMATQWQDLPHEFAQARGIPMDACTCGRSRTDELHAPHARELADAHNRPGLVTEKGT
jgi:hypothetical protein